MPLTPQQNAGIMNLPVSLLVTLWEVSERESEASLCFTVFRKKGAIYSFIATFYRYQLIKNFNNQYDKTIQLKVENVNIKITNSTKIG